MYQRLDTFEKQLERLKKRIVKKKMNYLKVCIIDYLMRNILYCTLLCSGASKVDTRTGKVKESRKYLQETSYSLCVLRCTSD